MLKRVFPLIAKSQFPTVLEIMNETDKIECNKLNGKREANKTRHNFPAQSISLHINLLPDIAVMITMKVLEKVWNETMPFT